MTKIAREQPSRSYPMRCWLTNLMPSSFTWGSQPVKLDRGGYSSHRERESLKHSDVEVFRGGSGGSRRCRRASRPQRVPSKARLNNDTRSDRKNHSRGRWTVRLDGVHSF